MKKTLKRLKKYKAELALTFIAFAGVLFLQEPTAPAGQLLHFFAANAAGLVIGYLFHHRQNAEKRRRQQEKAKRVVL